MPKKILAKNSVHWCAINSIYHSTVDCW